MKTLLMEAATFLDGLCIGHAAADKQCRDMAAKLSKAANAAEHDVTIHWANKPTYNRHKVALEIQDAGNMRAIAREFVKIVDAADSELHGTVAIWNDSAVALMVNKFQSLCCNKLDQLPQAWDECHKRAAE